MRLAAILVPLLLIVAILSAAAQPAPQQPAPAPAPAQPAPTPAAPAQPAPAPTPAAPAQPAAPAAEEEPKPPDEVGYIQDETRLSLALTQGKTDRYDYNDVRINLTSQSHYAFAGPDYLDLYVFVNRYDRAYDDPRYGDEPLSNILDANLNYVFGGVDRRTYGFHPVAGVTFFSDSMFEDVDFGVGYGGIYNYESGDLRLTAGVGRNLGYKDSWTPLLDFGWTHNQRLGTLWNLRTKADVMWNEGRTAMNEDQTTDPDAVYLLDGTLSYQLVKGWSLSLRYYNDNGSDNARSYMTFGVTHSYRRPVPKRK